MKNQNNFDLNLYLDVNEHQMQNKFNSVYQSSELKLLLKHTQTFQQFLEDMFANSDLISQVDIELRQMLGNDPQSFNNKLAQLERMN